jgi:hypothetical protein
MQRAQLGSSARAYDLWHDRALFHFLVNDADRRRYLERMNSAVVPGGSVIIATFSEDGPEQCSGLPTARYTASQLASLFGPGFRAIVQKREEHHTPSGKVQPFTWLVLKREV